MKAIAFTRYGPPELLRIGERPKPVPKKDELLVAVRAASVNAADWHVARASPFFVRFMVGGLLRPADSRFGADMAGVVEAVGTEVDEFSPGDEVFADLSDCGWGAFAEYAAVPARVVARKPRGVSFEQAAAVPLAGVTALQALRDTGRLQKGERVLINGAGGGVGSFAVQIARALGGQVTAVTGPEKLEFVRALGVDAVFDYRHTDFTREAERYDLILDLGAFRSLRAVHRALAPGGRYVAVGGSTALLFRIMIYGAAYGKLCGQTFGAHMARPNAADLAFLAALIESGQVKPQIDRTFPLAQAGEAIAYLETGRARGKVALTVA